MNFFERWRQKRSGKGLTLEGFSGGRFFGAPSIAPISESAIIQNSVIGACLAPLCAAAPQAVPIVEVPKDNDFKVVPNHPLIELLTDPGKATPDLNLSFSRLMYMLIQSDRLDGNAYIHKLRGSSKRVIGLQYIYHHHIEPLVDSQGVVVGYNIFTGGSTYKRVPREDIVHIACGIDPELPVKGVSPLKAAMRHVMTDNEIARYTHAVMRQPAPGIILTGPPMHSQEQRDAIHAALRSQAGSENKGGTLLLDGDFTVNNVGWTPNDMALDRISDLPEERICACLGVPPIIANLGAGLARSTFSNYEEANKAFYETTMVGFWSRVGDSFTSQLLYEFGKRENQEVSFETRGIRAMRESEDALAKRIASLFARNVIDRAEARIQLGLKAGPEDVGVYAWQLGPAGMLSLNGAKIREASESSV